MLLTAGQVAKMLGITTTTLYRWIEEGRFQGVRKYKGAERTTFRIPLESVQEFLGQKGA